MAASVLDRLRHLSHKTGDDYQFLLQRYAAERFLYRLGESPHREKFVLKGAMLLALWGGEAYRPTRDLDFAAYGSSFQEHIRDLLTEICAISCDDGVVFQGEATRLESIRDQAAYDGFRAKLKLTVGSARIPLQIDLGFGDAIQPSPVDSAYPALLDHPRPRIRVYPREAVVAEKLHAMVVLGARNSRYKDFYDLCALAAHFAFEGETLGTAMRATFELRRTPFSGDVPLALTPRFYSDASRARSWRNYLERNKLLGAPTEFEAVGERLSVFLSDIWHALSRERGFSGKWPPGGPWRYKPYPEYRDSGIEWLGEIPAHWEVARTKFLLSKNDSGVWGSDSEHSGIVVLRSTEQTIDGHWVISEPARRQLTESEYLNSRLVEGDLVVTKSSGSSLHIGKTSIVTQEIENLNCCFSNFMQRLRVTEEVAPRFAWYALNGNLGRQQLDYLSATTSGLANLNGEIIGMVSLAVAPMHEQRAIARYLDRETAKIDALVAKKERLIELLKEKRSALITHAVTRGLAPDAPMKDSGIEWLGEIPEHWGWNRLKTLAHVQLSNIDKKSVAGQVDVRLCNYVDVYYKEKIETDRGLMAATATPEQVQRFSLRAGDVLITKDSEAWTDIAVPALVEQNMPRVLCGYHLAHIRPAINCSGAYLGYAFCAIGPRDQFRVAAKGITRFGLSGDNIRFGVFPVPPLSEQQAIAGFLGRETEKIDALVAKVSEAIDRLKELRSALISAAVTGKIDVCQALTLARSVAPKMQPVHTSNAIDLPTERS